MIKNSVMNIVFLLIMGIFTLYPRISSADTCKEDTMNKAWDKNNEEINEAMSKFDAAASKFNTAAQSFISTCGEPDDNKGEVEIPLPEVVSRISTTQGSYDYTKKEYWENTKYYWDRVEASTDECKKLLEAVKTAKFGDGGFNQCRDNVNELAKKAANVTTELCECSDDQTNMMCEVNAEEGAQTTVGCKKFPQYLDEFNACPLCGLFEAILQTIAQVSSIAWNAVSKPLSEVVKIFFLVLLALEVLKAVSSIGGVKISEFGKNVLLLCAKAAITILLLSNPRYIYGYFLSPVIEGGLKMGVAVAQTGGPGGHIVNLPENKLGISSDTFDSSVYDAVVSTVREFGKSAAMLPAIGRGLTCYAWNDKTLGIPNVSMWLAGAIFYILGIIIWLAISFYMIDCTVQIGMLSGLVPLLIACWPFKMTESYSYKGCKMLMNSFFSYVMMGIVLLLAVQITTAAIGTDAESIAEALNNSDLPALRKACDLGGFQLLLLGACAVFAVKLIGQTNDLADQFSKGAGSSIGNKMGGMVAGAATNMAKSTAQIGGRVASSLGKHASAATGVTAKVNKGIDAIKGARQKGWAAIGRSVGLGKFQNQQTGSGKEEGENKSQNEEKEDKNKENISGVNPQNSGGDGDNHDTQNDNPNLQNLGDNGE